MAEERTRAIESFHQRRERNGIHLLFAVISDAWIYRREIQVDSSVSTASAFNIQARRHRCDLIEVDRTDAGSLCLGAIIIANGRKDFLQPFLGTVEFKSVYNVIGHFLTSFRR